MGSLQLACPLCCSETFPCHNSLKYHLLSINDNLNCPICKKKFEQVFELAIHIGKKCLECDNEEVISETDTNVKESKTDNCNDNIVTETTLILTNENMEQSEVVIDENVDEDDESTKDVYYCSSCDTNFTSIEKHIFEFHQGHEVLLEVVLKVLYKYIFNFFVY